MREATKDFSVGYKAWALGFRKVFRLLFEEALEISFMYRAAQG